MPFFLSLLLCFFSSCTSAENISVPPQTPSPSIIQTVSPRPSISPLLELSTSPPPSPSLAPLNATEPQNTATLYPVVSVADGDTITILKDNQKLTIRMIGIDTPEKYATRTGYEECFGEEASAFAKNLMEGKSVQIELDPTQGEKDKYQRTLAHVFLEDGKLYQEKAIAEGYGFHYVYSKPSKYFDRYKTAEEQAKTQNLGVWKVCGGVRRPLEQIQTDTKNAVENILSSPTPFPEVSQTPAIQNCTIKGNISSKGEKIYHLPGCGSYSKTVIDEGKGEHWFCTEEEALKAGWRKAGNC